MYRLILMFIVVGVLWHYSSARAQLTTFDSNSIYDLEPKGEQSTVNDILEKIEGNNDMQPIADLSRTDIIRKLSAPVGRLTLEFRKGWLNSRRKGAYCTASLIAKDLILTNYHCVPGQGNAKRAMLTMGYLKPRSRRGVAQYPVDLSPVEASKYLDYAILRVEGNPGTEWGQVSLSRHTPDAHSKLFVIHHPLGYPKYVTRGRCQTSDPAIGDDDILYKCDTLAGSSGAPVFDNNSGQVIGLNHNTLTMRSLNAGKRIAILAKTSPIIDRLTKITARQKQEEIPISSNTMNEAATAWEKIKALKDPTVFEAFRNQYGKHNQFYDRLAKKRFAVLSKDASPAPKKIVQNIFDQQQTDANAKGIKLALTKKVQTRLKELGCYKSSVDGKFGPRSKAAWRRATKNTFGERLIVPEDFELLKKLTHSVCKNHKPSKTSTPKLTQNLR